MVTSISTLDRQIKSCLPYLNAKQKKAVLNVIKIFVESNKHIRDKDKAADQVLPR
jgi:hypothetical protein